MRPKLPTKRIRRSSLWRYRAGRAANRLSQNRLRNYVGRRHPQVVHRQVECPDWPLALDGFTIVHLSDFHLGELLSLDDAERFLVEMVGQYKETPDLIVVTGDILDYRVDGCEQLLHQLAHLESHLGTLAVLGNHDILVNRSQFITLCANADLRLLINEHLVMKHHGVPIDLYGIDWSPQPDELRRFLSKTVPKADSPPEHQERGSILLAHHPRAFDAAPEHGIDLVLSGHTHGGQLNLVGKSRSRDAIGIGRLTHRYSWGVYEQVRSRLHVTSGIGSWFPFRVKCPSEIVHLTVRSGLDNRT